MNRITIVRGDITDQEADAIVNAANTALAQGGGVCGRIFERAGAPLLTAACDGVGPCDTGDARSTPGFALPASWVIHAVGPMWRGGHQGEEQLLRRAYRSALREADAVGARSIAFPVLSIGIYGYPADSGCTVAYETLRDTPTNVADIRIVAYDAHVAQILDRLVEPTNPPPP